MKIELRHVRYIPETLNPGILYVAEEFGAATHLCPCGCGTKVNTPLGLTEWDLDVVDGQPTLWPSIGNWQQACQSHYWIRKGKIVWAERWTPEHIAIGRKAEKDRDDAYYGRADTKHDNMLRRLWKKTKKLFNG